MHISLKALARKFQKVNSTSQLELRQTNFESLAVAQVEPEGYEATRSGRRYFFGPQNGVTGIAPVQTLPTTAAQWVLWNAETEYSLALEWVGVYLAAGTAGAGQVLLGAHFTTPAQTGSTATGTAVVSASSAATLSTVIMKSGVTVTTPASPSWVPLAVNDSANTAAISIAAFNADVKGRIVVKPGHGYGFAVMSGTGTSPLYVPFGCFVRLDGENE